MAGDLDITRLAELQGSLGMKLPAIVATLVAELDDAVSEAEASLVGGDLPAVALAAHAGRNSALMIGPGPVLESLDELARAAAGRHLEAARGALKRVRASWAVLRRQLQDAGRGWK